jgi:hypothetical protein
LGVVANMNDEQGYCGRNKARSSRPLQVFG